jgi:aspartate/methionine/tyrosine aminotransferase
LLDRAAVVCTPGSSFGRCGEGYVRISAVNDRDKVEEATDRFAAADAALKLLADGWGGERIRIFQRNRRIDCARCMTMV